LATWCSVNGWAWSERAPTPHHFTPIEPKDNTMLLKLITQHPQAIPQILSQTPTWVWGLLAALLGLGASQLFHRRASLVRVSIMPVAMTAFSLYGMASAFGRTTQAGTTIALWLAAAAITTGLALWWRMAAPAGTRFDAADLTFELPGSAVPLALIVGIFLIKYVVGIEVAMQPALPQDSSFAISVALLYGAFNGLFVARAVRLWRLVWQPRAAVATAGLSA
jgi:hypothetical protein